MKNRYSRNESVIGAEGQARLRAASVLIIGCGALGSPAAMYLAGAGIGRIGLVDFDTIDLSNLQRQVFYSEEAAGRKKAEVLASRIESLNSEVRTEVQTCMFTPTNAADILNGYDFVIEATDNPASKYMIAEACSRQGKPVCVGGVSGMRGQVTTFVPGHATFADIFPAPPDDPGMLPCVIEGVLGPAAGVISAVQASEAIKFLSGKGRLLTDRLFTIDLTDDQSRLMELFS